MKKAAVLVLEESVALELRRILDDDDGPAALASCGSTFRSRSGRCWRAADGS